MSGFYVNGKNITTLFKSGTVSASTNGGFRINNVDVKYTSKATSTEQSAIQTYFRILNYDLNTIFRDFNFTPSVTFSGITRSITGSSSQFPTISNYETLYITDGSGTCMFNTNVTIANIFLVGGGGAGSTMGTPLTSANLGGGSTPVEITPTIPFLSANTTFDVKIGQGATIANGTGQSTYVRLNNTLTTAIGGGPTMTEHNGTQFISNRLYYGSSGQSGSGIGTFYGGGGGGGGNGNSNQAGRTGGPGRGISPLLAGGAGGAGGAFPSTGSPGISSLYGGGGGGGGGAQVSNGSRSGGPGGTGSGSGSGGGVSGGVGRNSGGFNFTGGGGGGGDGGKNTGGGGGRGGSNGVNCGGGGRGGSGIVIILYNYI